jgi:hypothetical protein
MPGLQPVSANENAINKMSTNAMGDFMMALHSGIGKQHH